MSQVDSNTPMMQQFNALKAAHPDCILFFRAGDFYEMFGDDAVKAADILRIALTSRDKRAANPIPMCGVPHHAYEQYLNRLTAAGVKVAIAEQMEEPGAGKGPVRREVVRVVTPGTTLAEQLIGDDRNHYLAAIDPRAARKPIGLALADLGTGEFEVQEFADPAALLDLLARERPREVILPAPRGEREQEALTLFREALRRRLGDGADGAPAVDEAPAPWFEAAGAAKRLRAQFGTANLAGFGVEHLQSAIGAAGALLAYLAHTQKCDLHHITAMRPAARGGCMWLDGDSLAHLEIFENRAPGATRHTLFHVLNKTSTPMGARLLRRWLGEPLLEPAAIDERLDAVGELAGDPTRRERLRDCFVAIRDLERVVARISLPLAGIADIVALREALGAVQALPPRLADLRAPLLQGLAERFDPLSDVHAYLQARFLPEPTLRLSEGGYIAEGVLPELDRLRAISRDSRQVIAELEAKERDATGIGSLKIRFNKVFGYYLEISRIHQARVPAHYERKQTLVNAERYTTLELQELEEQILGADERIGELELEEFHSARAILAGYARRLQATAGHVATLDALCSFAAAANDYAYVRPQVDGAEVPRCLEITAGRHPVIERLNFEEPFVPNDVRLSAQEQQIQLITGPNMAGKSTLMRQVALIQLMAQAGSFVPAAAARLSVVDRIFTRVGATDNLSRGQSTFMLEMNEAANILNNATPHSLVVLDEIGRGTSTYDGISIAWAMVEHLHRLGALTLFATHYHELTQLQRELPRLRNYNMAIREDGERLVFTRKLQPGEADRSYGIQVARLAGLPAEVIDRAHEVMQSLTAGSDGETLLTTSPKHTASTASAGQAARARQQLSFLADTHPALQALRELDLNHMTPVEALNFLAATQAKLIQGGGDKD